MSVRRLCLVGFGDVTLGYIRRLPRPLTMAIQVGRSVRMELSLVAFVALFPRWRAAEIMQKVESVHR